MKKQTGNGNGNGNGEVFSIQSSVFRRVRRLTDLNTEHRTLNTLSALITALLLAGTAPAATKDWVGTSVNMGAAANWSPANVPGAADIARWNSSGYTFQPTMNTALTIGQLLFDTNNSGTVTISGSQTLTLNRIEGVGIQMTNGAVTINLGGAAQLLINNHCPQSFINNNPSGGNPLTINGQVMITRTRLTISGSGDIISTGYFSLNESQGLTMNGTGKLTLGGSSGNNVYVLANSGTLLLGKSSGYAIDTTPLIIGQGNATPALVQYTGDSANMIADAVAVTIYGAGQLDFNGKSDTIGALTINSAGASGDSTPITNSGSGGTLTFAGLTITPRLGYNTTINSGTGTNKITSTITFNPAGSGTARISGNLNLNNVLCTINIFDGEAANDMVIDAVISGASNGFTKGYNAPGRLVLGGSNDITGPVTVNRGYLTITNSSALGTASRVTVQMGDGASAQAGILELQGNIAVGALPLTLNSTPSYGAFCALRNVSGSNSWGGPITLTIAAPINSEKDTLTLQGTITNAANLLTIGGAGNTTITGVIGNGGGGLTKNGGGTLTLSGANTFTGSTTVNDGTLVLDYSTQDNSKLSDTAALTLSKGTLTLSGGSHTEANLSTTLNTGALVVNRSSGSAVLRMNTITRTAPGTIDFGADGIADCDNANTAGILGAGYATVGSNTWAYNSTAGSDGPINGLPLGSYTANAAGNLGATTGNSDMSSGVDTSVAGGTINSIRFNNAVARTLTISGGTLTVTSGGILNTAGVGGNTTTINGAGTISADSADLKIHQYDSGTLQIDAIVGGSGGLTKTGPGKLILGGTVANSQSGATYVNDGTLELNKTANVNAIANGGLTINQNGIVTYTGSSTDMIGTGAIAINENGQLDFNGASDTIGTVTIINTGASGNTTPIKNSGNGGNLTWGAWNIRPLSGCETWINSGTGTNTLGGGIVFNNVNNDTIYGGSGTARISGNLNLGSAARTFTVNDGDAYNDMVIDAVISGSNTLTKAGTGRLVLGGANTYTNTVTITATTGGILTLTNGNALGTADGATIVNSATTLELRHPTGITVAAEPLQLSSLGVSGWGGLRNVSGDNTWGGPVTLGAASRINSDSGTLLLTNTLSLQTFDLTVGSYSNVTLSGVISGTAGKLTKDGLGTLTLSGASANTFTNLTTITEGTLVLAKTAGVAVSNLTISGSATYNGAFGLVRYGVPSPSAPMISGTVTLKATAQGAGQLDFNGSTDTVAVVTIDSTTAIANSRPIVNTGNGGQLTINSLAIVVGAVAWDKFITTLDSGSGTFKLGGTVTCTAGANYGQAVIAGALDLGGGTRTFNVGLGNAQIYDLGISAAIANGSLTKTGAGRLYLSGVNTYAGDTLVSAGTQIVAVAGSILNSRTVTVATNATLQLDNASALGANAALALASYLGANYGKANLNFSGTQTVAAVRFDGTPQADGTWGSTSSTAANKNNSWFSGTGVVLVKRPPSGTVILMR